MKTKQYQHIVKKVFMVLPFYLFTFLPSNAQTFTQRVQQNTEGEGSVVIQHDPAIDELVNKAQTAVQTLQKQMIEKPVSTKTQPNVPPRPTKPIPSSIDKTETNILDADSVSSITYKRYKTTGFRVQVFRSGNSNNDRQQAEAAGNKIRTAFPDEDVYVEFFSPDWTCRVGNYRDIEDARHMRDELRKLGFDAATIVKGKIIISVPQQPLNP